MGKVQDGHRPRRRGRRAPAGGFPAALRQAGPAGPGGRPQLPAFPALDERLITSARDGDSLALAALMEGIHGWVRGLAHLFAASSHDAEDAAQEAMIVAFAKLGTLRSAAALDSWLATIVRAECGRRREGRAEDVTPDVGEGGAAPSAEERVLQRLEVERLGQAIGRLSFPQRQVVLLRDVQDRSGPEVAQALGLSEAAMRARLHRARTSLRKWLAPAGV